jgi:hypothetical protein
MPDLTPLLTAVGHANAWLRLESACWEGPNCRLEFSIDDGPNGSSRSRWAVTCRYVAAHCIEEINGGGLRNETGDHAAIRPFLAPRPRLLLRGPARREAPVFPIKDEVSGKLY